MRKNLKWGKLKPERGRQNECHPELAEGSPGGRIGLDWRSFDSALLRSG